MSRASLTGSVIVPAHNEAAGIARTLTALAPAADAGAEVIVVPNGCTDDTAAIAGRFPWARVVPLAEGSKPAALNAGDAAATQWPRVYLDADIGLDPGTIPGLLTALTRSTSPAGRPAARYDTSRCTPVVRAYYRARRRMPALHGHLWGAGCYAMTEAGRARFGTFPADQADDAWVDGLFVPEEKLIVAGSRVVVHPPRTLPALLHTLPRIYQGKTAASGAGDGSRIAEIVRTVRGPGSAADAAIYVAIAIAGKLLARVLRGPGWRRDASSRSGSL